MKDLQSERPDDAIHPGEYLMDELIARNWTIRQVMAAFGVYFRSVMCVANQDMRVSKTMAIVIASGLGQSQGTWRKLQAAYDKKMAMGGMDENES